MEGIEYATDNATVAHQRGPPSLILCCLKRGVSDCSGTSATSSSSSSNGGKTTKKVVRFASDDRNEVLVAVRHLVDVHDEEEIAARWYSDAEYLVLRASCNAIVKLLAKGYPLSSQEHTARGLERHTPFQDLRLARRISLEWVVGE